MDAWAYLHSQEYTGLKTLYLEQNALSEIEGLEKLVELRCLYLGKNVISQVRHSNNGLGSTNQAGDIGPVR
eukprot:scaffold9027_cov23-Tisochrysis_lutea.AAC.2